MPKILIIGNGTSRLNYDLDKLSKKFDLVIGCNALYRDFEPDILVALDIETVTEIIQSGYNKKHICYFRDYKKAEIETLDTLKELLTNNGEETKIIEKINPDDTHFVVCGKSSYTLNPIKPEYCYFVSGCPADSSDKAKDFGEMFPSEARTASGRIQFAGTAAIEAALQLYKNEDDVHIFLLGFDSLTTAGTIEATDYDKQQLEIKMKAAADIRGSQLDSKFITEEQEKLRLAMNRFGKVNNVYKNTDGYYYDWMPENPYLVNSFPKEVSNVFRSNPKSTFNIIISQGLLIDAIKDMPNVRGCVLHDT